MYIPINEIIYRHKAEIKGIIHLGAHLGEESKDYHEAGIERVIWVEGNPALMEGLTKNVSAYPHNQVVNLLISDKDNSPVTFNVTSFSHSSSILELGITKEMHDTRIIERVPLTANRLDNFIAENKINIDNYNFLNIDLQGYELVAMKSMGKYLDHMDWVYTEVNVKHLYKNCALLYQVDLFLLQKGFERVEIFMTTHFWGDALYRRKKLTGKDLWLKTIKIYSQEGSRQAGFIFKAGYNNSMKITKTIIKKILGRP